MISSQVKVPMKKTTCEAHYQKLNSHVSLSFHEYFARKVILGTHETLCLAKIKYDFPTLYPYYIYRHYPQNCNEDISKENSREVSTTHSSFREKATHPLVRNHCNLFSFPLPLLYLERRFVPKHNSHLFIMFWSLGSI